jgi:hypothetical protein
VDRTNESGLQARLSGWQVSRFGQTKHSCKAFNCRRILQQVAVVPREIRGSPSVSHVERRCLLSSKCLDVAKMQPCKQPFLVGRKKWHHLLFKALLSSRFGICSDCSHFPLLTINTDVDLICRNRTWTLSVRPSEKGSCLPRGAAPHGWPWPYKTLK